MNIRIATGAAFAAVVLLASAATFAAGPGAVRKQVEASMLVTGRIQVDTSGKVSGYSLDQKDKLPPGVVSMVDKAVPNWEFKPVLIDGKATNVTTDMSIRVVAKKIDADNYSVAIRSAGFGDRSGKPGERIRTVSMAPPDYPESAARAGVTGTVYLLVRAGRDGTVIDAIAEQVNLKVVADENSMAKWRRLLGDTSIRQARRWTFSPPTEGDDAKHDFWIVRVPVVFSLDDPRSAKAEYGRWEAYIPGPRQANPWEKHEEGTAFSPDTLAPGGAYLAGAGLKLLTELSGS
ncbi:energy transducer TonB [Lysobacter niabensis]|uniref:energy transducer TonB n=1 Tax=Agrilutibacter niabensis TaxID=380628 RepID=UPI003623CDD7